LDGQQHTSDLLAKVKAFEAEDKGQAQAAAKWQGTSRRVGIGSQILANLGVTQMRLLSSPKKYHSLSGFGLEVTEYVGE
ncbi:MAG: bifunctional 3,4-dihydroxy-2-butanone-4-phosphate synthase/GTP cyclohydrolase II, partial [Shewanella sp.]